MKKRIIALLLVLVMVLGVLPVQAFAEEETADIPTEIVTEELPEEAPAVEETQPETVPEETEPEVLPAEIPEEMPEEVPEEVSSVGVREMYWKNPLFADLDMPEFVDDGLIPVMPRAVVTPSAAVEDLKTKMIARTSKVVVETYFDNDTSLTEEEFGYYLDYIWSYVLLSAMVHDGTPDGGDYLYWHVSDVDGEIAYDNSNSKKLYVQLTYKLTYTTSASQEKSVTSKVEDVLEDIITAGMTDYEKVKAIYDYIIGRVTYDDAAVDNPKDILAHTAFGAIIQKSAVCDGYAVLFYRMCLEAGIDALMITGLADGDGDGVIDGAHAWNVVRIDGYYYNVDVTWDDAVLDAGYDYAYFLKCNEYFEYDHIRDDGFTGSNYNEDLPMATWDFPEGCMGFGKCGDNAFWIVTADGVMTVFGTGEVYDKSENTGVWKKYKGVVKKVVIEEGITSTGNYMLNNFEALTEVSLPSTLERIGGYSFSGCKSLTEIAIPVGVQELGEGVFLACTNLEKIHITDIADWCTDTFKYNSVFTGDAGLYLNGELVTDLAEFDEITIISAYAFYNYSGFETLTLPPNVTNIRDYAFYSNDFTALDLANVQRIGFHAFERCQKLTEVTIPASVTYIDSEAFRDCDALERVTIHSTAALQLSGGFNYCNKLEEIVFTGDAPNYVLRVFADVTATAYYPAGNSTWTEVIRDRIANGATSITWIADCMGQHTYETVVKEPTCTEAGYTTNTCQYCGDSYVDAPADALGHNFTDWAEVDGITSRTCQNEGCGLVEYESCAKNLTTGKLYSDLSVALGEAVSGDTVVLLSDMDATAAPILVFSGVTLDLSGYSLQVNYLIGLKGSLVTGNVVDKNGENGGKLVVPQNGIVLPEVAPDGTAAGYKIIPVWNGDHYIFSQATISNQSFTVTGDTSKVMFLPNFSSYIKNSLFKTDGCEDNDVSVIISVSWMESGIWVTQEYFYTTSLIIDAMNNKSLYAYMTGCDTKEDLVFRIAIVTGSGAQVASQEYIYAEQ